MPRSRKTMSGVAALPVQAVSGQQYGKGVAQAQLQKQMPAPAAPKTQMSQTPAAPQPAPARPTINPTQAAQMLKDKVGLLQPATARPTEPVTAGLRSGPGPGPEVLGMNQRSPLGETMRMLSRQSGDNFFAQLADRAGL